MFFIVIGVGIILLHFLGLGPMANWTWNLSGDLWKFAVPFALAAGAALSAIVIQAVWGLLDLDALRRYLSVRRNDFLAALAA